MRSRNSQLGFMMIDHRNSPGVGREVAAGGVAVGPGELFEADCASCAHCQRIVVLNPLRIRDRAACSKCDAYICDLCAAVGECNPFARQLDVVAESIIRGRPLGA